MPSHSFHEKSPCDEGMDCKENELLGHNVQVNDTSKYCSDADAEEVIGLNIRGNKMIVARSTLTSVQGSMLAAQFSGRWDQSMKKDEEGNFIVDIDYDLFCHILDCLQNRRVTYPIKIAKFDAEMKSNVDDIFDFYGLKDIMSPVRLEFHNPNNEYVKSSICGLRAKPIGTHAHKTCYVSYTLALNDPKVRIKSLKVQFSKFGGLLIKLPSNKTPLGVSIGHYISFNVGFTCNYLLKLNDFDVEHDLYSIGYEDFGRRWFINEKLLVWNKMVQDRIDSFLPDKLVENRVEIHLFGGEFEICSYECSFEW